jgi:hypothetical protein
MSRFARAGAALAVLALFALAAQSQVSGAKVQ